jgi:hypothetical protein
MKREERNKKIKSLTISKINQIRYQINLLEKINNLDIKLQNIDFYNLEELEQKCLDEIILQIEEKENLMNDYKCNKLLLKHINDDINILSDKLPF